jgi:ATP-dependent Lhr-like helicase
LHATAQQLLARYGVVTRGTVVAERVSGGFAAVYSVLKAMEDAGRCRRGYFVEGLGGAQFAQPGAVDRLRTFADTELRGGVVLAAIDPANPFGAALQWPERDGFTAAHRPGRKAGAFVVLSGGALALYIEKGGRSILTFTTDEETLRETASAAATAVQARLIGSLSIERIDGAPTDPRSPIAGALRDAGFTDTPKGLRLRGRTIA